MSEPYRVFIHNFLLQNRPEATSTVQEADPKRAFRRAWRGFRRHHLVLFYKQRKADSSDNDYPPVE